MASTLKESAYLPYSGPEEFILEWTDRIWVRRGIGLIRENYAADAVVHGAYGTTTGVEGVVRSTLTRINAYPERVGQGEDVIWEARGDDAFLSSHRVLSIGAYTGIGHYGPPNHRSFRSRAIANCLYRNGVMEEEWLVRDEYAIVQQLGLDPQAIARTLAFDGGQGRILGDTAPADVLARGESGPRENDHRRACELVLDLIDRVWNERRIDLAEDYVVRDLCLHTSRDRTVVRPTGYQQELISFLAPVPDAVVQVRDVVAHEHPEHGVRVSALWWLRGTYCGVPAYGAPTNTPVELMGCSQFRVVDGRITHEWRVYDEMALLTQIVHARGDEPSQADRHTAGGFVGAAGSPR
ncbi:ester cyclase [Streptomyces sp. SID3343]|uniref:nuclear transport factor 2 family protein n=1 Tax=Streptomyces sp. SID3343 TaxID=2690260 RepID=UPI001367CBCE|nr:ester cyclase [Streptomyces sp. SID3343]MYW02816.1 hypothetical protein [Streptomyces sp. SID3343]